MGKSEGLRAEVEEQSAGLDLAQAGEKREISGLSNELAYLQSILASLNGDK